MTGIAFRLTIASYKDEVRFLSLNILPRIKLGTWKTDFSSRLAPFLARFVGAEDAGELLALAETMVVEASRPWGGRWRERELLFDPPVAGRHDRTERFVRRIMFGTASQ